MKNRSNLATLLLLPALALLPSCASKPDAPKTTSSSTYEKGVPGGTTVETYTATAPIVSTDSIDRTVTLLMSDGTKETIKCGPEVRNFSKLRKGDEVKVVIMESLAVEMAPEGTESSITQALVVARAPEGGQPAAHTAGTVHITATVTQIDVAHQHATLRFANGTVRTFHVRPDVDLSKRKVGEKVNLTYTQSIAISVDKP